MTTRRQRSAWRNMGSLRKKLRRFPEEAQAPVRAAVRSVAERILDDAQRFVPKQRRVLMRALRIKYGRDGFTARIGYLGKRSVRRAYYAAFVEFGTRKMRAQPFMGPAFDANLQRGRRLFRKAIDEAIKRTIRTR